MGEKERQYFLLGFAALFLLLVIFYYLYVTPILSARDEAQVQLAQKKTELAILDKQKEPKDSKPPQEKLKQIAELFPVQPYTDELVKDLGSLQAISRVSLESASFEEQKEVKAAELAKDFVPEESQDQQGSGNAREKTMKVTRQEVEAYLPQTPIRSMKIKLGIKGDYEDVYDFVSEVQQLSRYLRVDKLSFTRKEVSDFKISKEKELDATLEMTSYYAPQFAALLEKTSFTPFENPSEKWNPLEYPVIKKEDWEKRKENKTNN
jgi:hypothetical protein